MIILFYNIDFTLSKRLEYSGKKFLITSITPIFNNKNKELLKIICESFSLSLFFSRNGLKRNIRITHTIVCIKILNLFNNAISSTIIPKITEKYVI